MTSLQDDSTPIQDIWLRFCTVEGRGDALSTFIYISVLEKNTNSTPIPA